MMHERGKSDSAVVATKPANKAERSAAELVEQRAGTKGNADQQSTRRAQYRESVSQALGRIRQVRRQAPEVGAVCIKVHVRICAGGVGQLTSLPRPRNALKCCK
jgi:RNA-directed DNA polymerase